MTDLPLRRLALLIDIDNSSARTIEGIMAELERLGRCDIRLAFGDHDRTSASWREACLRFLIKPRHYPVFAKRSKNAADIAMVITAMDLLHSGLVDAFAIVSRDTDFVPLALRIKEAELQVYGFGPWGTSERFRKACTRFFFTENLMPDTPAHPASVGRKVLQEPRSANDEIRAAIARLHPSLGGWVDVDDLERELVRHAPDFDPRTYGKKTLLDLLKAQRRIRLNSDPAGAGACAFSATSHYPMTLRASSSFAVLQTVGQISHRPSKQKVQTLCRSSRNSARRGWPTMAPGLFAARWSIANWTCAASPGSSSGPPLPSPW